jgi:hypothetical protein
MPTVSHYLQSRCPTLKFKCDHCSDVTKCGICFENNILDSLLVDLKISESQTKKRVSFEPLESSEHAASSRKTLHG